MPLLAIPVRLILHRLYWLLLFACLQQPCFAQETSLEMRTLQAALKALSTEDRSFYASLLTASTDAERADAGIRPEVHASAAVAACGTSSSCLDVQASNLLKSLQGRASADGRARLFELVRVVLDVHEPSVAMSVTGGLQLDTYSPSSECSGRCVLAPDVARRLMQLKSQLLIALKEAASSGSVNANPHLVAEDKPSDWLYQTAQIAKLLVGRDRGTSAQSHSSAEAAVVDQLAQLAVQRLASLLQRRSAAIAPHETQTSYVVGPVMVNLGDLKRSLLAYHDELSDGLSQYERDRDSVIEQAIDHVRVSAGMVKNPAVVLDIDETSLDNWPMLKANDFGFIYEGECPLKENLACGVAAWERSASAPAVRATRRFFEIAKRLSVAVFFITGRGEEGRLGTERNLRAAGYDGWTGLLMRDHGVSRKFSASTFKGPARASIWLQGYRVIANVGDQPSDLAGGFADRTFLLPNPYYRIP